MRTWKAERACDGLTQSIWERPGTALQPAAGRWLSQDPLYSDLNLYRYCWNNPVLHVDSKGLWVSPWDPNANWVWPWDPNATWEPAFIQSFEIIAAEMEKVWGQLQCALRTR